MRTLICLSLLCAAACGSSTSTTTNTSNGNNVANGNDYALLITNKQAWCNVTAALNGNTLASFGGNSATIQAPAGATIDLDATPQPSFQAAQWTGTTSATSPTTYVMTTASNQNVSVYCP